MVALGAAMLVAALYASLIGIGRVLRVGED
jgi:hypothetical protein